MGSLTVFLLKLKGGLGSGNHSHDGRPGQIGGSSKKFSKTSERVWQGEVEGTNTLSKLETGDIGEKMVIAALKDHLGVDLVTLNVGINNSPIDLGGKGIAVEVKAGTTANSKESQRWRANLGEFGKAEKELVAQMSPDEKKEFYGKKSQRILERKNKLLQELSEISGEEVKGYTAGVILSPDGKRGDVFLVPGFHLSLGWSKYAKEDYYVGSYSN